MKVSVVVTSYDISRYDDLKETVESIIDQEYENFDLVLVLEDEKIVDKINKDFDDKRINIKYPENSLTLSKARNLGCEISEGELVVFTDDDVIVDQKWLEELVDVYKSKDDLFGVGGSCKPLWPDGTPPSYIPSEFYWIFGVTYTHHPKEGRIRNTFGCNIGFDKETFLEFSGFNEDLGKKHGKNIQGEETELCDRIRAQTGESLYYNPEAEIKHKVYKDQMETSYLFNRSFWQGYTKAVMTKTAEGSIPEERSYLKRVVINSPISRIKNIVTLNSPVSNIVQIFMIFILTLLVGFGFLYGKISYRV